MQPTPESAPTGATAATRRHSTTLPPIYVGPDTRIRLHRDCATVEARDVCGRWVETSHHDNAADALQALAPHQQKENER